MHHHSKWRPDSKQRVRYGLRSTLYYWLFRRFSVPPQQRLIGGIRWLVSPRFSWSSSLLRTCELYILAKSQFSACSSVLSERRLGAIQALLRSVSVMCLFDGLFAAMSRKFSVWVWCDPMSEEMNNNNKRRESWRTVKWIEEEQSWVNVLFWRSEGRED